VVTLGAKEFMLKNILAAERPHPGYSGSDVTVAAECLLGVFGDIIPYFFRLIE
jgi:hypothetical protein